MELPDVRHARLLLERLKGRRSAALEGAVVDQSRPGLECIQHGWIARVVSSMVRHQEQIVALQEKRLGTFKARSQTSGPLDLLRATDAALAAKQLLEEIQSNPKKA